MTKVIEDAMVLFFIKNYRKELTILRDGYYKFYLMSWFSCMASMPFLILLLAYQKPFSHMPPGVFVWCLCVVLVAGVHGVINGRDIFFMYKFDRSEYWIAAKKGMIIAAKTALTSTILISFFHPLLTSNKTELNIPMLMVFYLAYFLFGFVVFSWLILGFGAIGGVALLFVRSIISQRKKSQ